MENKRKRKQKGNPVLIIGAVVLVVVLVIFIQSMVRDRAAAAATQAGIAFLESMEAKDPADVDAVRRELYQKRLDAQREELLQQLHSGAMDPFSLFQDYVILGDSRAVGFYYMGFLDESRVLATGGATIRDVETHKEKVIALDPSQIFLCYGLNDISIGYWDTAEEYVAEYMQVVADLRQKLPNATVVVSSALPARDPAFARSSKWRNIPDWNQVLQEACDENDVLFVDNSRISEEYADLWDPDGIHVKKEFYPHWATELIGELLVGGSADEG